VSVGPRPRLRGKPGIASAGEPRNARQRRILADPDLGRLGDSEIAARHGVSHSYVCRLRRRDTSVERATLYRHRRERLEALRAWLAPRRRTSDELRAWYAPTGRCWPSCRRDLRDAGAVYRRDLDLWEVPRG